MNLVDVVVLLVVLQYLAFVGLVSRARSRYGIKAPAISGAEEFERAYRVQMNTLELMVALLPALWLAAKYWPAALVAAAGAVYLLGRLLYWRAYMTKPASRHLGFLLSIVPIFVLVLAALQAALFGRGAA